MRLIPYNPFPFSLPSLFDENDWFGNGFPQFPSIRVDVRENPDEVIVLADIPGLEKKEDVDITIHDQHLHLSGEIRRSSERQFQNAHRTERYVGRFTRTVPLPAQVDEDQARASYKNGVLEIVIPKSKHATGRRIDVDFLS